jgi:hypothetical protein
MHDFIPLAEIQKLFTFHPLKTYRLFSRFRQEGKLHEESGWITRDNQILINMPQFIVELQAVGYSNFLRDEINRFQEISNDEQMKSDEIERNQVKPEMEENTAHFREEMKSADYKSNQTISSDEQMISNENSSNQMKSSSDQMISDDFIRAKEAIIDAKDEIIKVLQTSLDRAEKRIEHLEGSNDQLAQQNQRLTHLTYVLVAPERKAEPTSPRYTEAYTVPPEEGEVPDTAEPAAETAHADTTHQDALSTTDEQSFSSPSDIA